MYENINLLYRQTFEVSNYFYCSDIVSELEVAKVVSKPMSTNSQPDLILH